MLVFQQVEFSDPWKVFLSPRIRDLPEGGPRPLWEAFMKAFKFYLIVAMGKHKGMPIPVAVDLFMIGTAKMCQLRSKVEGVGEEHCTLIIRDRKIFVRDMASGYPTTLNGELVQPGEEWPMHPGDRLDVGPLEFMIQFSEKPLSGKDLEEWAARSLDVTSESEIWDEEADEFHKSTSASQAAASIIDRLQAAKGLVKGRLRVGRESGVTTIRFNDNQMVDEGEIAYIKKELCDNLNRNNLRVLLDCKNLRRMSSGGVKMLGEVNSWLKGWGSTMALCRVHPDLVPILTTLDLAQIPVFPDKSAALAARW